MSRNRPLPVTFAAQDLIDQIRTAHANASMSMRSGVEHAIKAGELLIEAKRLHSHGQWTAWIADNLSFSDRTARAYMQLARMPIENRQRVAELPLRETLSALRCRQDRIARADDVANRPPPGPATLVIQGRDGNSISIPAPNLVIAPGHRHLLEGAAEPGPAYAPPSPDEVADGLIAQLEQCLFESTGYVTIAHLQAAFVRRFGMPQSASEGARETSASDWTST